MKIGCFMSSAVKFKNLDSSIGKAVPVPTALERTALSVHYSQEIMSVLFVSGKSP
jgi:hypothetical protein